MDVMLAKVTSKPFAPTSHTFYGREENVQTSTRLLQDDKLHMLEKFRCELIDKYCDADQHFLLTKIAQTGSLLARHTRNTTNPRIAGELRRQFAKLRNIFTTLQHNASADVVRSFHKEVVISIDSCLVALKFAS
ncbi:hypothetical protein MKQ68_11365 [Chitinophaga horti]|uniref:Four helix bundle protein n=1 Tax=Chitinophaga horti TaxID=2920382 RepID=A0ABY6J7P3_9BACT|nr:hypothetical protein [Chitinophaga horti]UYQ95700.1 hypothetical protein MKQ68_11365 [Chitinophaga horti]